MTTFYIKQGDLLPQLQIRLTRTDPITGAVSYVNLQDVVDNKGNQGNGLASVKFFMSNAISGLVVDAQNCEISAQTGDTLGEITYTWQDGDTDAAGKFNGEFEVTWSDGKPETFPADSYQVIQIKASLDGV